MYGIKRLSFEEALKVAVGTLNITGHLYRDVLAGQAGVGQRMANDIFTFLHFSGEVVLRKSGNDLEARLS